MFLKLLLILTVRRVNVQNSEDKVYWYLFQLKVKFQFFEFRVVEFYIKNNYCK